MIAFNGQQETKDFYIKRIQAHIDADDIIKRQYWEDGKGDAVGCTVHSNHDDLYETELGIPRWIARLENIIFSGLPIERAKTWPLELLQAVNVGSDLSKAFIPMLIFITESAKESAQTDNAKLACEGVLIELHKETLDLPALIDDRTFAVSVSAFAAANAADVVIHISDVDEDGAADPADLSDPAVSAYVADTVASAYNDSGADVTVSADKLLLLIKDC